MKIIKSVGLGKRYNLSRVYADNIRDAFSNIIRPSNDKERTNTHWAVKDLTFDVNQGEAVGVIGKNGAGKSTLLKILSRITYPTTGSVEIVGRVGSLLEVGTGFHPELTGIQNVFLNGAILGMSRREIKNRLDEIVDFSGVKDYIHTPIKHYSSGMKVRLAFSVAAHLEPEVLLIDEVLAVGDAEFQAKCIGKMDDVAKSGRTVLFVSHDLTAISRLCEKTILLENGHLKYYGDTNQAFSRYLESSEKVYSRSSDQIETIGFVAAKTRFKSGTTFTDSSKIPIGSSFAFELSILSKLNTEINAHLAITIYDSRGIKVSTYDNLYNEDKVVLHPGTNTIQCLQQEINLLPDTYFAELWLSDGYETLEKIPNAFSFELIESDVFGTGRSHNKLKHGMIYVRTTWKA